MKIKMQSAKAEIIRVHGRIAREFFNAGGEIFIAGVGDEPKNAKPLIGELPFDRQVSAFKYKNCKKKIGYYPAFYFMVKVG